jgi:phosphoglycerate dehydrogenase-like enzyme
MPKSLKVLILPTDGMHDPWLSDFIKLADGRHKLLFYDYSQAPNKQVSGVDVIVDQGGVHGTRAIADCANGIRLCQILGTGFDHFDLAYWRTKGMPICNTPGQFSAVALGETALMFILMMARGWHVSQRALQNRVMCDPVGFELEKRRLLIVGLGASGRELARRAKAFGMRMSAIEIAPVNESMMKELGIERTGKPEDLDKFLPDADFVSLHLHYNEQTHHTIDGRRLALMKKGSYLVNVSRGALADENALYEALTSGHLAGAGLDVFSQEPADPNSPLLKHPNVVATPHIAGVTLGTSLGRAQCVLDNIDRVSDGLAPLYRIDQ